MSLRIHVYFYSTICGICGKGELSIGIKIMRIVLRFTSDIHGRRHAPRRSRLLFLENTGTVGLLRACFRLCAVCGTCSPLRPIPQVGIAPIPQVGFASIPQTQHKVLNRLLKAIWLKWPREVIKRWPVDRQNSILPTEPPKQQEYINSKLLFYNYCYHKHIHVERYC